MPRTDIGVCPPGRTCHVRRADISPLLLLSLILLYLLFLGSSQVGREAAQPGAAGVYPALSPNRQWETENGKTQTRYTVTEQATLKMLIKPVERWTADEYNGWVQTGSGFRHFAAANVTPIEHYRPKPWLEYNPVGHPTNKPAA